MAEGGALQTEPLARCDRARYTAGLPAERKMIAGLGKMMLDAESDESQTQKQCKRCYRER